MQFKGVIELVKIFFYKLLRLDIIMNVCDLKFIKFKFIYKVLQYLIFYCKLLGFVSLVQLSFSILVRS